MNEPNDGLERGPDAPESGSRVDEPLSVCWRCGKKATAAQVVCAYCGARFTSEPAAVRQATRKPSGAASPLLRLVWIFSALLLVSLIYGWIIHFGLGHERNFDRASRQRALIRQLVVELVDSMLIVGALLWVGRPPPLPKASRKKRLAAWLLALPVLAVLLAANFGYAWLLRNVLLFPSVEKMWLAEDGLVGWIVLANCIQPAIVEEFFCRYLALGVLRTVTGIHAAILISSIMFGMAHIFNPLFIPVFIVIGMALGYLRVMSGVLILPILLHFEHNSFIILSELWL
jgi:membrane protease YdiL (CAAX protease family)